ncbi:MAG: 4-hydroxy-3-methylbut-2-enyl diphosphate reductase [Bacteroidetes bacterium]|jgi:4-hydroxy-3-methylbut-2-enyl diphosphate reductase|nr:4-hydroxy-3-methylbut-2-enyl diphosphate reductase [Bacteroidota bacterium]MBK8327985.1 4-hydroxy-3-methylbut-2-enyl diphosphate reductase [Bacteroidota bacterium]
MKSFEIPEFYRSPLISAIKNKRKQEDKLKKDFSPTHLDFGSIEIFLARHFGFCYGVENAIEIAFKTVNENPGKRIFLLSEMIHNPQVNADLIKSGVRFIMDTLGNMFIHWNELSSDDIVIIPAFGTTLETESRLKEIGIDPLQYNTTCPFVEKVWNRSEQIGNKGYTIIIHGKPGHEETRATFSHSSRNTPSIVVKDLAEAEKLEKYIKNTCDMNFFYEEFKGQYSDGFDVKQHFERIGVVNQTTMLASDTQSIADYLKRVMLNHYALDADTISSRFADTRDTLCYATNDNQSAVMGLLHTEADLALVVGGYNSSNTSHLVELCEEKLPTFFIENESKMMDAHTISHFDLHTQTEKMASQFLPLTGKPRILITSGASCPDAVVEKVILKLISFYQETKPMDVLIKQFE